MKSLEAKLRVILHHRTWHSNSSQYAHVTPTSVFFQLCIWFEIEAQHFEHLWGLFTSLRTNKQFALIKVTSLIQSVRFILDAMVWLYIVHRLRGEAPPISLLKWFREADRSKFYHTGLIIVQITNVIHLLIEILKLQMIPIFTLPTYSLSVQFSCECSKTYMDTEKSLLHLLDLYWNTAYQNMIPIILSWHLTLLIYLITAQVVQLNMHGSCRVCICLIHLVREMKSPIMCFALWLPCIYFQLNFNIMRCAALNQGTQIYYFHPCGVC